MLRGIRKEFLRRSREDERGLGSIGTFVNLLNEVGVYPPFITISEGVNEPQCVIGGEEFLLFSSNNYLSLSEDPRVKEAAKAAIDRYGIGPGASRCLAGDITVIRDAERVIASHIGTEDCLTFPTGYMVNVTLFQALLEPFFLGMPCEKGSAEVFYDELNHGSIRDGILLTSAKKTPYRHADLADLERKLAASDSANRLIVTEGVYCLEGEITPVPDYIALKTKYGAWLLVDDAHGVGVVGEHGGGVGEHFGCAGDIDLLMGSMDKAFGGTGGYVGASRDTISFLRIACRSSLLSSALPCIMASAVIEGIDIARHDRQRRSRMNANAKYLREGLRSQGFRVLGEAAIPSLALYVGDEYLAMEFAEKLFERRIFASAFRWPATPQGKARIRLVTMANHTQDHLDRLLVATNEIGHELNMLGE